MEIGTLDTDVTGDTSESASTHDGASGSSVADGGSETSPGDLPPVCELGDTEAEGYLAPVQTNRIDETCATVSATPGENDASFALILDCPTHGEVLFEFVHEPFPFGIEAWGDLGVAYETYTDELSSFHHERLFLRSGSSLVYAATRGFGLTSSDPSVDDYAFMDFSPLTLSLEEGPCPLLPSTWSGGDEVGCARERVARLTVISDEGSLQVFDEGSSGTFMSGPPPTDSGIYAIDVQRVRRGVDCLEAPQLDSFVLALYASPGG